MSYSLCVQPAAWGAYDPWGADWVTDLEMARAVAALIGVPCVLWRCPAVGTPMRLCSL